MDEIYRTKITNKFCNPSKIFPKNENWRLSPKKQRIKNKKKIVTNVFKYYIRNTTLHGIKYLGPETSNSGEKLCWIIGCITSILCCIYLIFNVWNKWQTSPVILSFNQELTPIWEIPFPAVTVCPTVKVEQNIYNYTKKFKLRNNLKTEEYKKFWDVSLICDLEFSNEMFLENLKMNFTDELLIDNLKSVIYETTITNINWLNTKIRNRIDNDFFTKEITEEGICFTFNSLSQNDMYTDKISQTIRYINHDIKSTGWTVENGYPKNLFLDTYPKRTTDNGFFSGLTFVLNTDLGTRDYLCGPPYTGFKIILHNPAEPARPSYDYILISANEEHTIVVKPEMTVTDPSLVTLDPYIRKCFFSNERNLKFFKIYTLNNCRMECLGNMTLHSCGCVPFYMPREKDTKICAFGKLDCVRSMQSKIIKLNILDDVQIDSNEKIEAEIYSKCDCLPSCTSLSFSAELSKSKQHLLTKINKMDLFFKENIMPKYIERPEWQVARIDIFFKEAQFLALYRSEIFGSVDFFSNIGGLLGLFMGFSVLSLLELFYYLSIHLWCRLRQHTKNNN